MKNGSTENGICIELHYSFFNTKTHAINFQTRNTCALAQVEIISYVVKTLFPNECFEILSLPAQDGSFRDFTLVKFLNNNPGVIAAATLITTLTLLPGQIKLNKTSADINTLNIIEKCKEQNLGPEYIQKAEEICNSYYPKKQKNIFFKSIIADQSISSIRPIITGDSLLIDKEISRIDFSNYLEELPKEKEFLKTDLQGNIQLSQPVIDKQQQYGRGLPWKGIYYGEDVLDENQKLVLEDGESVFFYMQDDEYKVHIINQEISFTSGDNIGVIFDVSRSYDYLNDSFGKPKIYVKRVISQNDNLVQHKKELAIKKSVNKFNDENKNQRSLFEHIQ